MKSSNKSHRIISENYGEIFYCASHEAKMFDQNPQKTHFIIFLCLALFLLEFFTLLSDRFQSSADGIVGFPPSKDSAWSPPLLEIVR